MERLVISNKTKTDSEVTYDDDISPNKSTKLPQLLVQVKIFFMKFPDCLTARTVAVLGVALRSKNLVNKVEVHEKGLDSV